MASSKLRPAVVIVSDTAAADPSTDRCGAALTQVFQDHDVNLWEDPEILIVSDDKENLEALLRKLVDPYYVNVSGGKVYNLVVTSGGTGFATRDHTPEVVDGLLHKRAAGLVHGMLAASLSVTPFALMSRPVAGVRHKSVIITLPGSPKGAKENLEAVIKLLPHACRQAAGEDSRTAHAGGVRQLEADAGLHSTQQRSSGASATGSGHDHHHHDHHHHGGHGGHVGPKPHTDQSARFKSNDLVNGPSQRSRSSPYPMFPVKEALALIEKFTPEAQIVQEAVTDRIVGAVVAEDVHANEPVPAFRASIVDGYAIVKSEKGVFPVAQISHAQAAKVQPLQAGQVGRITTGAPLPPGASAVVMVEDTRLHSLTDDGKEEKEVEILTDELEANENVREEGSDVEKGAVILRKGEGISATGGELGLLASTGVFKIPVYRRPVVGVLSTGNEIVQHHEQRPLELGEVRDTNRPTLLTTVRTCGYEVVDLGIASDTPKSLEEVLRSALSSVDVVITTGGVSMGELDLLKPTIERALDGTIHFGRVAMKPGKPTTFATVQVKNSTTGQREDRVIFSLAGNPASAVVTFYLFVLPALHKMAGIQPRGLPSVKVVLDQGLKCDTARTEYQRALVTAGADGLLHAVTTGGQRSSRIGSFKGANALLCIPPAKEALKRGDKVDAVMIGALVGAA